MAVKKVQTILIVLSVVISAGVGVLAFNTAEQVSDGITGTAGYYSSIVGPAGSATQLAMNTMYFTDSPLGTIPYSVVSDLQKDSRINSVIPFSMADSYNGFSLIGTTSAFLDGKDLDSGNMFDDSVTCQVVVGYRAAQDCGLKVGDTIYTSHSVGEVHKQPFTVTGILKQTYTVYDNVIFTQYKTIWEVHDHEHEGEEEHEEHEEHDHGEMNGMVCAVLIKAKNPGVAMTLINDYDGKIISDGDGDSFTLQAINPMETVRGVLDEADNTRYIVFILCAVILIMNILVISIITLLNMYHSTAEISLMRLIGIGMKKINLLYIIQNSLIGLVSCILAFIVSHLCLGLMGDYVAGMGVVLDPTKVYSAEIIILAMIFVITVLPTVICTFAMSRKDGLSD